MKSMLIVLLLLFSIGASEARDQKPVRAFRAVNPCPATDLRTGPCKGYVVDHIWPLCAGGEDAPANMQWQKYKESLTKDRIELALCRELNKTCAIP